MGKGNLTKHQRFEIATIQRGQITEAPYNPRIMDGANRKLLDKSMKANGLVEPLVWNKRSGVLVGGHQRLAVLDALEKGTDYSLTVSVVDVDEREERNLNMALNNRNLQGDWDNDALAKLLTDLQQADYDAIGVTDADLDFILNDISTLGALTRDGTERTEAKGTLDGIKQQRGEMNKRLAEEQRADFFAVVVFEDADERAEFYRRFGLHLADQYVRARDLSPTLGA